MGKAQTINYIVSVEDEQAYDKQCQITFSFETPCTNGLYLDTLIIVNIKFWKITM